jgi:hypothetical protein
MTLQHINNIGFIRHDSLNMNIFKKEGQQILKPFHQIYIHVLSNYDNPSGVAPLQSSSPLHVIVETKMTKIKYFLTLSFQHLVSSWIKVVNLFHEDSLFTLHSSLFTLHSSLFTFHSSLFTLHSSLFILHFSLFTLH